MPGGRSGRDPACRGIRAACSYVALMVALNRADEFRLHVRAAFNNGVTRDEIKEVVAAVRDLRGVPAANTAFHLAQEVFNDMDAAK